MRTARGNALPAESPASPSGYRPAGSTAMVEPWPPGPLADRPRRLRDGEPVGVHPHVAEAGPVQLGRVGGPVQLGRVGGLAFGEPPQFVLRPPDQLVARDRRAAAPSPRPDPPR